MKSNVTPPTGVDKLPPFKAPSFVPPRPTDPRSTPGHTGESDYVQIKSAYANQKLPKDFEIPECKSVKHDNQHLASVVNKCARYTETALKVLWSTENHTEETLTNISTIICAQINFLQSEQAALSVQSNFSSDTAKIFKSLQSSKSTVSDTALENIKTAAALAAVKTQEVTFLNRGAYGRGFGRSYRGRGYDNQRHNIYNLLQSPKPQQSRAFFKRSDENIPNNDSNYYTYIALFDCV